MDVKLFENDQHLVHGDISIADSLTSPAAYGTYSIRLPYPEKLADEKLAATKIILWSCMDRRVVGPLYDSLLKQYKPEEILVISIGGGPIQVGEKAVERIKILREMFIWLSSRMPSLQKIWAVAHTGGCGGVKYFCGGHPITEVAKPEIKAEAAQTGTNEEIYATDLLIGNGLEMLPKAWQAFVAFDIAQPDETNKTVKLHPHRVSRVMKLEEVVVL